MALRDVLWANIERILEESGESLTSLARRAKVPQSTLQRFSAGTHQSMSLEHIEKLAQALRVPPAALFQKPQKDVDPRAGEFMYVMESLPDYAKDAAVATVHALADSTHKHPEGPGKSGGRSGPKNPPGRPS